MHVEIRSIEFAGTPCHTRIPFRFGVVTLRQAPVLTARVRARVDGVDACGHAADLCVPKWFEKDAGKSAGDDMRALLDSAVRAGLAFSGGTGSPFDLWLVAYRRCVAGELASGVPLVDGFGVALVERALIDACCRAAGLSFGEALSSERLGFEPGALLEGAAGIAAGDWLAGPGLAASQRTVLVRHTVGGLDPLLESEVPAELRGSDGHPVALEEDIARYGLCAFKLKVGGVPDADFARLVAIARVVEAGGVERPIVTFDGNETYPDLDQLARLLDRLAADPDGERLVEALAYVEQPLPRARTLDPATADAVRALASRVPLLIDEADDRPDAFARAFELGYRGVSVKNCKGVFRALANRALCSALGDGAFQTSEDLTNLPVLALQQDLATVAALGLPHSERNGHHFFAGLDVLPPREAEAALRLHPDLYEPLGGAGSSGPARIVLRIRDGALSLGCADAVGYGSALGEDEIDWAARTPIERLRAELPE